MAITVREGKSYCRMNKIKVRKTPRTQLESLPHQIKERRDQSKAKLYGMWD